MIHGCNKIRDKFHDAYVFIFLYPLFCYLFIYCITVCYYSYYFLLFRSLISHFSIITKKTPDKDYHPITPFSRDSFIEN